jgi:hypothetical protein
VRITVIATGFERGDRAMVQVPETVRPAAYQAPVAPPPPKRAAANGPQIVLPYDVNTQITKEYASPPPPTARRPAQLVEEPEIHVTWDGDEAHPVDGEAPRLAHGSGPAPLDSQGTPLVAPSDRKRAQSRPSMKAVLAGEIDSDSELDVPTFIRRHGATHS